MILRIPDYFENFVCIGGKCKKSCCIGWELEVDEDTFDYYQNVPGEFGDRLRKELHAASEEDFCGFCLPVDGRCPFLNDENLCDIVLNLGEEALCDICTTYPRHSFSYGDYTEKGLTVSCEEACRLLFCSDGILNFKEIEIPNPDYPDEDEISSEEVAHFEQRQKTLFDMISSLDTDFEYKLSQLLNDKDYPELRSKDIRLQILSELEPIDSEWLQYLGRLSENIHAKDLPWDNKSYSKLLTYFLYRYLPRGLYDGDIDSKIRFALFCVFVIRDLEDISPDIQYASSLFSREVEHSEENIERIMEELLFL